MRIMESNSLKRFISCIIMITFLCPNSYSHEELAPPSLLKLLERYSQDGRLPQHDVIRMELLDDFLRDTKTREYILKEKRFPAIPREKALLLNGFFEAGRMTCDTDRWISFNIILGGKTGEIYFFRNPRKRGYRIRITDTGCAKVNLSLIHKGTADDPLRVVLIMPRSPLQKAKPTRLPIGLMSLASCLRDKTFLLRLSGTMAHRRYYTEEDIPEIKIYIIDLQAEENGFDLGKRISEINPDVVAVSATTPLFNSALQIGEIAEQAVPNAVRIMGGVHVSAAGMDYSAVEKFFESSTYQAVILREGEEQLSEFMLSLFKKLRVDNIEGVFIRGKNGGGKRLKVYAPPSSRLTRRVALNDYPMPARSIDLLRLEGYDRLINIEGQDKGVAAVIFTSRGCPYGCRFCASHSVFGKRVELLSAEKILEEVKYYYSRGFRAFYIVDDNFCFDKQRIPRLADLMEESGITDIEYSIMARADFIDTETAKALKRSGCKVVAMGVESGDQTLLRTEVFKNINLVDMESATQVLRQEGIYVKYFLMTGLPGQDWKSIRRTAEFIITNRPDAVDVFAAVPYPGSEYSRSGRIKVAEGIDTDYFMHSPEPQLKQKDEVDVFTYTDVMTPEEIAYARDLLMLLFNSLKNEDITREIINEIDRLCHGPNVYLDRGAVKVLTAKSKFINRFLKRKWEEAVVAGWTAYDPRVREYIEFGGMSVCYVKGRQERPGGVDILSMPYRFRDSHKEEGCVLCEQRQKGNFILAKMSINGRVYELAINTYPAGECHFLLMKEGGTPEGLSQYVQGPEEIRDLLTLQRYLSPEYLVFFNTLPGAEGTDGTSSVNHWHTHIIKNKKGTFHSGFKALGRFRGINSRMHGVRVGVLKQKGANCRVFEGEDIDSISNYAFLYLKMLNREKISYNMVFCKLDNGILRVIIVPRKKGSADTKISGKKVMQRYGPTELNGHFVMSEPDFFRAIKAENPDRAMRLLRRQLADVGFSEQGLIHFDGGFLHSAEKALTEYREIESSL